MKITVEALTTAQRHLILNAALKDSTFRADANYGLLNHFGQEAFKNAQFGLKMAGLMNADYSLTTKGNELFNKLRDAEGR